MGIWSSIELQYPILRSVWSMNSERLYEG